MGELTAGNDNFREKSGVENSVEVAQKVRKVVEAAHRQWPSLISSKIHQETYDEYVRANKTPLDVVSMLEMLMMTPERIVGDKLMLSRMAAYIKYVEVLIEREVEK